MILFDNVVKVLDLTDLDAGLSFGIVPFDRRGVGRTFVDRDLLRRAIPLDRLAQEPTRRLAMSFGGEQEINRGTSLIDGPIQVLPATLDLHIGLIHAPAGTHR